MPRSLLLVALTAVLASPAAGQELTVLDLFDTDLYKTEVESGDTRVVGDTGVALDLWHAMAKDSNGRLIAARQEIFHPYELYEIDSATGQATFVAQTNLLALVGLAFGPDDVLYGIESSVSFPHEDKLVTIDLGTGNHAVVGGTEESGLQSLAWGQGGLWSWEMDDLGLVTIDPETAQVDDINPRMNEPAFLIQSLAFSDNGVLYGSLGSLYMIDTETGVPSHVAHYPFPLLVTATEFPDGEPDPFALWQSGLAGDPVSFKIAGATPGGDVLVLAALWNEGSVTVPRGPCAGTQLALNNQLFPAGIVTADAQGNARLGPTHLPTWVARDLWLQAVDLTTCEASNPIWVLAEAP